MPHTKIVCTIGPASSDESTLRSMITRGMNVARLNFSHGSHEDHLEKIQMIRAIADDLAIPVGILQDLCGPKIRLGRIPDPGFMLNRGETVVLTSGDTDVSASRLSVSYPNLPREVNPGDRIMLADGFMEVVVRKTTDRDIICDVVTGGLLTSNKGINLPMGTITAAALTEKDRRDLKFGLAHDVDYVAMSFVRRANDVAVAKDIIAGAGKDTPVIAKIEKHEAVDHIDDILDIADGIMVARGDLGVEIPLEQVPNIQKRLIRKANTMGKPVIIATQMLRSMVDSPHPTRAEATDVANGVLDGADAVMLSEETAAGNYPVAAVEYMARIAVEAESQYPHNKYLNLVPRKGVSASVSYAACILADQIQASAIVATTRSGSTAKHISHFRPGRKIIALSPDRNTIRRLTLYWGCVPCHLPLSEDTDEMIEAAAGRALDTGHVRQGDSVVITAGRPVYEAGTTNMLWVKDL